MLFLGFVGLFSLNLLAEDNPGQDGYVLLDMIITTFRDMAMTGSGGFDAVDKALQRLMAESTKAFQEKKIDAVFYKRYARVLSIMKLSIIPDPQSILRLVIKRELAEFVAEKTGEEWDGKSIGQIAAAMAEEIINLHIYLDTTKKRAELMKEFEKKSTIK